MYESWGSEGGRWMGDSFRAVSGVDLQVTGGLLIELVVSWFPHSLKMRTTFCVPDIGHWLAHWLLRVCAIFSFMQQIVVSVLSVSFLSFGATNPQWVMASSFTKLLDRTQWRTTVGRTPLDEWSAPRRNLSLTTHNTHNLQISMPPAGFEPTVSAGERSQIYAFRPRGHWDRRFVGLLFLCTKPIRVFRSSLSWGLHKQMYSLCQSVFTVASAQLFCRPCRLVYVVAHIINWSWSQIESLAHQAAINNRPISGGTNPWN